MKLDPRRLPAFLADPGAARAVLLHGEDAGAIRAHADALTRAVAGSLDDAFRVAVLERERHGRLEEEAGALSLMGGRRVVRVREAGEAVLPALQRALAGKGEALLVLEAPGLGRGRLRPFVEGLGEGVAIACHPEEGRALAATIRAMLAEREVRAGAEVVDWLVGQLGADREGTRGELEKLALYVGPGGEASLEDAQACVGDASLLSLDEALFAATAGDVSALDRTLERALAEGAGAISVLRPALSHLMRLHQARGMVAEGMSAADAMRALRPPVFWKRQAAFTRALSAWSLEGLGRALEECRAAEMACKSTGMRDAAVCRRFLMAVGRRAGRG